MGAGLTACFCFYSIETIYPYLIGVKLLNILSQTINCVKTVKKKTYTFTILLANT